MEHEEFGIEGFEFMNEPATDEQKRIIAELAEKAGTPIDVGGRWPNPFTKWDAKNMIDALQTKVDGAKQ